jgi:hypothetical protein
MLKKALTTFFRGKRGLEYKYCFYNERGSMMMRMRKLLTDLGYK